MFSFLQHKVYKNHLHGFNSIEATSARSERVKGWGSLSDLWIFAACVTSSSMVVLGAPSLGDLFCVGGVVGLTMLTASKRDK